MTRIALLAACFLVVVAACDDETKPALTSTSSSTGVGGSTGGTGGGSTSGTGGGSSSGSGGSTSGTGGGSSSSGIGGGQGECNNCAEYFAECFANGCPTKNTVCLASIQLWDAVFSCFCMECITDCEYTCAGYPAEDTPNCPTCLQTATSGTCSAQMMACNADTN